MPLTAEPSPVLAQAAGKQSVMITQSPILRAHSPKVTMGWPKGELAPA